MSSTLKLGKVKFYDPNKDFGFIRDLHVASYVEKRNDYYFNRRIADQENYATDDYVLLTFTADDKRPLEVALKRVQALQHTGLDDADLSDIIDSVPDAAERSAIASYMQLTQPWRLGRVDFFDTKKGFGFTRALRPIGEERETDLYMHESDVAGEVGDGDLVWFKAIPSRTRNSGLQAVSVSREGPAGDHTDAVVDELVAIEQEMIRSSDGKPLLSLNTLAIYLRALPDRATLAFVSSVAETEGFSPFTTVKSRSGRAFKRTSLIQRLWRMATEALDESSEVWPDLTSELRALLDEAYEQAASADQDSWFSYWKRGWMSTFPVEAILSLVRDEGIPASDELDNAQWVTVAERIVPLLLDSIQAAATEAPKTANGISRAIRQTAGLLNRCEAAWDSIPADDDPPVAAALAYDAEWLRQQEETLQELIQSALSAGVVAPYEVFLLNEENVCTISLPFEAYDQMYADKRSDWRNAFRKAPGAYVSHALETLVAPALDKSSDTSEFKWWANALADRAALQLPDDPSPEKVRSVLLLGRETNEELVHAHQQLQQLFAEHASPVELLELYRFGYTLHFPADWVGQNISDIDREVLEDIYELSSKYDDGVRERLQQLFAEYASPPELLELYRFGYVRQFPADWVYQNIGDIGRETLEGVFEQSSEEDDEVDVYRLLDRRLEVLVHTAGSLNAETPDEPSSEMVEDTGWVFRQADRFLPESRVKELWERFFRRKGLGALHSLCVLHEKYAWRALFPDDERFYELFVLALNVIQVTSWTHHRGVIDKAYGALEEAQRKKLDEEVSGVSVTLRSTVELLRWLDGAEAYYSLGLLTTSLHTLEDVGQLKALRKLFHLHEKGQTTISREVLYRLSRHLFTGSSSHGKPGQPLAYSVEVAIQILIRLYDGRDLVKVRDLIEIARTNVADNPKRRLSIKGIFNACEGRMEKKWDWSNQVGEIKEFNQGNRRFYEISFAYDPDLVEAVRKIPGRRYEPDEKVWICPADREEARGAVEQFAAEHSFFIDGLDGKHYSNNPHLCALTRGEVPTGVTFCEGRKAKKRDTYTGWSFWWCRNRPCYESCHGPNESWEAYTVTDFARILELPWSGTDRDPDDPANERFMGYVNRANELLEKLYCYSCDEMLAPRTSSNYGHYRITEFYCDTHDCPEKEETVYLHHCLNGKCRSIIDSRESCQCPNGWYICTNLECGCCCSTATYERREANLQQVRRPIPATLARQVHERAGHQERAQHFCYKCGSEMDEVKKDVFVCPSDGVSYDTARMNFDRGYRRLKDGKSNGGYTPELTITVTATSSKVNDPASRSHGSTGKADTSTSSPQGGGQDPNWPPPIEAYE